MSDENNGTGPRHEDEDFVTGSHFAKLYASILDSSVWEEATATRCVWVALLVMCDSDGFVEAADPGIYRRANVTASEGKEALRILASPDVNSKSQEWGGRRIERVARGWKILNYEKYRGAQTAKQKAAADRQARFRERRAAEAEWLQANPGQRLPPNFHEEREALRNAQVTRDNAQREKVNGKVDPTSSSGADSGNVEKSVEGGENPTGPEARTLAALETDLDREAFVAILAGSGNRYAWAAECWARLQGMHPPMLTPRQLGEALRDYWASGKISQQSLKLFRAFLARPDRGGPDGTLGNGGNGPTGDSGPKGAPRGGRRKPPPGPPQSYDYGRPTESEEEIKWQK